MCAKCHCPREGGGEVKMIMNMEEEDDREDELGRDEKRINRSFFVQSSWMCVCEREREKEWMNVLIRKDVFVVV